MKPHSKDPQKEFAKMLGAACVRRGYLEKLHAGTTPITHTGDFSDVKVTDATGNFFSSSSNASPNHIFATSIIPN